MVATKKVERQETVVVVKAVEVSPLLFAVNGIVGRIDIDDDLFRRLFVGFDEEFDEEFRAGRNFLIGDSIFESGEGGGTAVCAGVTEKQNLSTDCTLMSPGSIIFQFWDIKTLAFRRLRCYNVRYGQ